MSSNILSIWCNTLNMCYR